jgi:2-keto-4-pentenoate hydratase/2-oxohepta-3-ene-1,7-dioic acid hydratase in catechol pathway
LETSWQIRKAATVQLLEIPGGYHMTLLRVAGLTALLLSILIGETTLAQEVTRYVRYSHNDSIAYGVVDGDQVHQLSGAPWGGGTPTGAVVSTDKVDLLAPAEPSKVIAVGYNYISHREDMTHEENRPIPEHPPLFLKLPTTITGPGTDIVYPADATDLHYEGELVVVIGKTASQVSSDDAHKYIFGVTAGNDVSERDWQANDLQWLRAKASDTFGPLGPSIVTGLNYLDLRVQTRLNGETMQDQSSRDHIHDIHAILSFVSQYVTLLPGDIIYTGTPGSTSAMKPGDVVEIEVEGVGVLRNQVVAGKK